MHRYGSISAFTRQYARDGEEENLPVERQRPVVDVLHIQFHPGVEIEIVAAGYGPEAGEAGAHTQAAALPALVVLDLVGHGGARTYQGHIALQDVPKLRPFIDRKFAQIAADDGEARV